MAVGPVWRGLLMGALLLAAGCKKQVQVQGPALEQDELVRLLRERPVPDPVQARLGVKGRSDKLSFTTPRLGGGLIVDRPDRGYLVVTDPVGSPVITLATSDGGFTFLVSRGRQYVHDAQGARELGTASGGTVTMDDVMALLLGLLPVAGAEAVSRSATEDGLARIVFRHPTGLVLTATVDPAQGTPVRVEVDDAQGRRSVEAVYQPFEAVEGFLLPTELGLWVPSVELDLNIRFKGWKVLEVAPDVFTPERPSGYEDVPFDAFVQGMANTLPTEPGGGDTTEPSEAP